MEFRSDINGLRAFAVIIVMLYHFALPGFSGGFAGVDIFFVISGYLMTAIIAGGLARGTFRSGAFFLGRIRRLLPALVVLCAVLMALGWFWLSPLDYKQLGRHAATALTFASNFIFKNESGYFDSASQDKWLLHTWSLSAEWQFYLLYPFLLIAAHRLCGGLAPRRLVTTLGVLVAVSFAFCVVATPRDPALAFFLLPARLWEMALGGLVWALAAQGGHMPARARPVLALGGIALMIAAVALFDDATPWPGSAALLPALGCALVLAANAPVPAWLSAKPLMLLGLWSYSIYLWHWPVAVLMRQLGHDQTLAADAGALVLSVTLGGLSYRFVETPLRQPALYADRRRAVAAFAAIFLLVAGGSLAVDKNDGLASRADPRVIKIEQDVAQSRRLKPQPCASDPFVYDNAPCTTAPATPDYILWGDSHASSIFTALDTAAGTRDGHTYQATCPPVPDTYLKSKKFSYQCPDFTKKTLSRIASLPHDVPLVVAFRMAIYTEGYNESPAKPVGLTFIDRSTQAETPATDETFLDSLHETLCTLAAKRPVFVMKPVPEIGVDVPREISRDLIFKERIEDVGLPLAAHRARMTQIDTTLARASTSCGVHLLDPAPYLCDATTCHGSIDGVPLYTDDNHLGMYGAARLVPMFRQVFSQ